MAHPLLLPHPAASFLGWTPDHVAEIESGLWIRSTGRRVWFCLHLKGAAMRPKLLGERSAFSEKLSRLGTRLRDPHWRKYGLTLIAGKMIALVILFVAIVAINRFRMYGTVFAQDAASV